MKLSTSVSSVQTNGLAESMDFSIKVTGKAFKILLDGLYADKVAAVIRELSTNAYDAHLAIGKGDVPFNVHLPTLFSPTFIVRDFGVSMSHEQTMRLMSTVFDSTKDDSNNQVGAFGLGSKSPFALVDTFSLNVVKDGERRMYSAFVGPNGVPTIALLGQEKTSDPQGVEFQMTIAPKDVSAFRTRALRILRWFPTLPKVYEGTRLVDITPPPFIVNGSGWQLIDTSKWSEHGQAYARQGCVVYPLDKNSIPALSPDHAAILSAPIVIDFAIGSVDVAASREALSYEPQTCKNIVARLNSVIAEITDLYGKAIKDAPTLWEAGHKRVALYNDSKLPRHLIHAIGAVKWKGTVQVSEGLTMEKQLDTLKKAGTLPDDFKCYAWDSWRMRRSAQTVAFDEYTQRNAKHMHWEYGRDGLCIYFTEEGARPTHEGKRIRSAHNATGAQLTMLFVVKDDAQRVAILDAMGNPPDSGWTKDLASPVMPPRAPAPKRGVTKKVEVKVRELVHDPAKPQKYYSPAPEKVVQLDGDAYYAIQREGRIRDLGANNDSADPTLFFEGLTHAKLAGFMPTDGFPIYLISSTYQKRVEAFGKWKKIDDYISGQLAGYEDKLVAELEQKNIRYFFQSDHWVTLLMSAQTKDYAALADQLKAGPLHDLSNVIKTYLATVSATTPTTRYYDGLRSLRFFGLDSGAVSEAAQKKLNNSKALKELNASSEACAKMYPLIGNKTFYDLSRPYNKAACLEYIEAVDVLRASKAAAQAAVLAASQAAANPPPAPGP